MRLRHARQAFRCGRERRRRQKNEVEKENCKAQLIRQIGNRLSHKFVISTLLFINLPQINTFVRVPWELFDRLHAALTTPALQFVLIAFCRQERLWAIDLCI